MKKTIIALMALCSVASAADLVAEWEDFSTLTSCSYTIVTSGSSKVEDGLLSVVGAKNGSATIDLSAAELSISDGFTLSLTLNGIKGWSGNQPHAFVGIKGEDTTFLALAGLHGDATDVKAGKFAFSGSANNVTMKYPEGENGDLSCLTGTDKFYTLTFAFTKSAFSMYLDGVLLATGTPTGMSDAIAAENITSIAFGSWAGDSSHGLLSETISSFSIYDGVMTASEVAALIPEPTTATLSLLALAGLAARRRRK